MFPKFFRKIHKILGLILSILFLMWFISGIVMIYHSFPKVNPKLKWETQKVLSGNLSSADSLWSVLPDSVRLMNLSVDMSLDRPVFHLKGRNVPSELYADSLQIAGQTDIHSISRMAEQLCRSSDYRVDTLSELDQWIPFGYLKKEFPIYKFSFNDLQKQQLYVSSKTGKVLQLTDRNSRFWAWVGAIPHWVYFTSLRQNQAWWTHFMVWASALGTVMCMTGLWVGVWAFYRNRKNGFRSPYKKWWHRWHHISGMVFGFFALTFVFSGMMSLVDLPSWMQKGVQDAPKMRFRGREGGMLPPDRYVLDYRKIRDSMPEVKGIEWTSWGDRPYYVVYTATEKISINALDSNRLFPFRLTEDLVRQAIVRIHGKEVKYTLSWINEFDEDYYSRRGMLTLPVYKVVVDDRLHTRHYFNPETLYHRQVNDNSRLRGVLYGGLHSLNFKCLTDRPVTWNVIMYVLLIGGTFLSLSGVILTLQWLRRGIRKIGNRSSR